MSRFDANHCWMAWIKQSPGKGLHWGRDPWLVVIGLLTIHCFKAANAKAWFMRLQFGPLIPRSLLLVPSSFFKANLYPIKASY